MELNYQDVMREPFVALFKEELPGCRFANNGRELIESMNEK